jgi:hypothetical protein
MFHEDSDAQKRGAILSAIADLLQSVREAYTVPDTTRNYAAERAIENFRDELLSLLSSGIDSHSQEMKAPSLRGAEHLVHIAGFLSAEEITYLVSKIDGILMAVEQPTLQ